MSANRNPNEEALEQLILELRAEAAPELDWDRVEARLMREPKTVARSATSVLTSRLRWPAVALVAAAAAFALVKRPQAPVAAFPPKATAQLARGPLNGDTLALGTRITAGKQAVVVEHQGRARWTLEPHATAFVSNAGELLTVQLESGALSAAVVPNTKPETFAVEAGGTRVAVHGTAFRVERSADRVLVQVSEGTVAVEPAQTHSAPSFLLRRDSRGNFALDGRTGSVEGNASVVVGSTEPQSRREIAPLKAAPHPAKASPTPAEPVSAAPALAAEPVATPAQQALAPQPSISDIESGVSSAIGLLNGCFRDQTHSAGIRVSASTAMTLSVAAEGTVQSVTFTPPLAPAVEDCAVLGLRTVTFAHSVEGVTFTRLLELTR
ncbi:MAG TPA: FecR domain-containing protein [Polyangiaceae bacterium]